MKFPKTRYVIALKEYPERYKSAEDQLEMNKVKGFNFWWGNTPDGETFESEIKDRFIIENKDITPGGKGSLLSAYKLWEHLYALGVENVWVIEEDIYFRPGWREFIESIPEMDYDLITFCSFNREAQDEPNEDDLPIFKGNSTLYQCNHVYSQLSYFISRKGLKIALNNMKVITERTKDRNFAVHVLPKINSYSVYPSVCVQRAELESVRNKFK